MNRMPEWPLADDCDHNDLNMTPEEFRRAKACWKACDGFPTDALENGSVVVVTETVPENDGYGRLAHRHPAEQQRDRLLAVLEFAREKIAELHAESGDGECHYPIIDDAIASVKGGAV